MKDHVFTLGIEEEFQIVDPQTRELRSHIQEILADGKMLLKEHVKPEMHQSVVELGTDGWIQNITGNILTPAQGKILFVFTSLLMFSLRFCADFIEKNEA